MIVGTLATKPIALVPSINSVVILGIVFRKASDVIRIPIAQTLPMKWVVPNQIVAKSKVNSLCRLGAFYFYLKTF